MRARTLVVAALLVPTAVSVSARAQTVLVDAVQGGKILETAADGKMTELPDGVTRSAGGTYSTASNQSARLILEDGTELLISQDSSVTIDLAKPGEPPSANLKQGTVKVQVPSQENNETDDEIKVEHVNREKPYRFFMQTRYVVLGVRGTEFLVDYDSKSQQTQVHTLDGIVDAGESSKALKAGSRTSLSENHFILARAREMDAPRAFDRETFSKQFQSRHPHMMKVMNSPMRSQSDFKGMQIRREFMKRQGGPSTLNQSQPLLQRSQQRPGDANKRGGRDERGGHGERTGPRSQNHLPQSGTHQEGQQQRGTERSRANRGNFSPATVGETPRESALPPSTGGAMPSRPNHPVPGEPGPGSNLKGSPPPAPMSGGGRGFVGGSGGGGGGGPRPPHR